MGKEIKRENVKDIHYLWFSINFDPLLSVLEMQSVIFYRKLLLLRIFHSSDTILTVHANKYMVNTVIELIATHF